MMEVWDSSFHSGITALTGFIVWLNQAYGARCAERTLIECMLSEKK